MCNLSWTPHSTWSIMSTQYTSKTTLIKNSVVRGRSQLSTFMKAYREYARGEGVRDLYAFFLKINILFFITENVL